MKGCLRILSPGSEGYVRAGSYIPYSELTSYSQKVAAQLGHFIHLRKLELAMEWYYDPDDEQVWDLDITLYNLCAEACRSLEWIFVHVDDKDIYHWKVERDLKGELMALNLTY